MEKSNDSTPNPLSDAFKLGDTPKTENSGINLPDPLSQLRSENKSNMFKPFGDNKITEGTKDFLSSNTMVAKISFLLLVLIIFTALIRLGSKVVAYFILPKKNPILINGLKSGK